LQFRLATGVVVFLGSYLPLSMILLAQDYDYAALRRPVCWNVLDAACGIPLGTPLFSVTIFALCFACFVATLFALKAVPTRRPIILAEARYIPADLMNYTLPYVVSFMSLDYRETGKFVGLLIFLGWMFWITYKSGQLIMNPILIAFGWRHYEISYTHPGDAVTRSGTALAKGQISPGDRVAHNAIQDVLIIRQDKTAEE
jgi:hypothetical protein